MSTKLNDTARMMQAMGRAISWHDGQRRKGEANEPYAIHLAHVAQLIAEATGGEDADLVIAGILHDAVEDAGISLDALAMQFGRPVADLVKEVTDDKSLPKEERKRLQIENAPHKTARAAILKLADNTSNVMALAVSPPKDWDRARLEHYVDWAEAVVARLPERNPVLMAKFEEACELARKSFTGGKTSDLDEMLRP